eukprot:768417-Hanusia_phi.AAC.2
MDYIAMQKQVRKTLRGMGRGGGGDAPMVVGILEHIEQGQGHARVLIEDADREAAEGATDGKHAGRGSKSSKGARAGGSWEGTEWGSCSEGTGAGGGEVRGRESKTESTGEEEERGRWRRSMGDGGMHFGEAREGGEGAGAVKFAQVAELSSGAALGHGRDWTWTDWREEEETEGDRDARARYGTPLSCSPPPVLSPVLLFHAHFALSSLLLIICFLHFDTERSFTLGLQAAVTPQSKESFRNGALWFGRHAVRRGGKVGESISSRLSRS